MEVVILISANVEWRAVRQLYPTARGETSPYGEWFPLALAMPGGGTQQVLVFHGGWGKIAAAGSTQYVIDRWHPRLIVNLGTCGGFSGEIERGAVLLVARALVYDIIEQMGDYDDHIAHYTTEIDLSWVGEPLPTPAQAGLLVSADRDLLPEDIPRLKERYGARAGDWESGSIAWVAGRNGVDCLILRGVSDLVGEDGGEAYGAIDRFESAAGVIMQRLFDDLPAWLARWKLANPQEV